MQRSLSRLFFTALCTMHYVLCTTTASAQEVSLIVSPPNTLIESKAGETVQKTVKVTNNSETQELNLKVHIKNFIVQDDAGTPILVDDTTAGKYMASTWFTLENDTLTIPAKTTSQMAVIITIPKDALPGGHYAGVFFEPIPSKNAKATISYTSAQVGSLFALTIPGDIKYDALIKEFKADKNVFEFGPVEFSATIENQSDTHISPVSSITIYDMIGRKLEEIKLDDVNIFPFTARTITGKWNNVWGLGRYSAIFNASYGPGLVATRTMSFWIMPYRLIATILIAFMVLLALFISIRRHIIHRSDNRDAEIDALKRRIVEMENKHL